MSELPIDLDAYDLGHMARYARTATFAPNWKAVLAADAAVGLVIVLIGLAGVIWVHWLGWFVVAAGVIYTLAVGRRALQWRWLRQQVGM